MQRIWQFTPWLPYEIGQGSLVSGCRFCNSDEVFDAGMTVGRRRDTPFPVPQLELTLPDFSVDCFTWDCRDLVSERMREAMALSPDDVEYFPVDTSRCAAVPRAMNYMVMNVVATDRVSYSRPAPASSNLQEFLLSSVPGPNAIDVTASPRHRLFVDEQFIASMYCTDELAMSVLSAGCTGVRFFDPRYSDASAPMRFRTLRGVEEEGDWDPVNKVEHTTLVEEVAEL
jgi:hypothetical protein